MRQNTQPISQELTVTANGLSATSWPCDQMEQKTCEIGGTFSGSVAIFGTLDGTNYVQVVAPVTVPSIVTILASCVALKLSASSWVSGTATGIFSGLSVRD